MSDALSSVGAAAVQTIGTAYVVGTTAKVVGKAIGGGGGHRSSKKSNYNVWNHGGKKSGSRKSKMLGY